MKEYDIFLKNQPEGKVIIYMLTYYVNFSVRNGLLIDVDAYEKAIKRLSVSDQLVLQAKVLSTNKRAFEQVQNGIVIAASPNFSARKYVEYIEPNIISIETPEIDVIPAKILNGVNDSIEISQSLSEVKCSQEKLSNEFFIQGNISEIAKVSFLQGDESLILASAIDDLLYRDIHFDGKSAIEVTAHMSAILKRFRLLIELDNNCTLGSTIPPFIDSTLIQRYVLLREIDDRILADVDEESFDLLSYTLPVDLPYIDNMTLEELDYVIIED